MSDVFHIRFIQDSPSETITSKSVVHFKTLTENNGQKKRKNYWCLHNQISLLANEIKLLNYLYKWLEKNFNNQLSTILHFYRGTNKDINSPG